MSIKHVLPSLAVASIAWAPSQSIAQTGGCCLGDGTCVQDVTADECEQMWGIFFGPGDTCDEATCALSVSCCCVDGECIEAHGPECNALNGIPIYVFVPPCDCDAIGNELACEPPLVVHPEDNDGNPFGDEDEIPEETEPHSGYVDPRMESVNGVDVTLGPNSARIRFNRPVAGNNQGGPVTLDSFQLDTSGESGAPQVQSVTAIGGDPAYYELQWDPPLAPGQWLTIQAVLYSQYGVPITSLGDLGPGALEPDRIDIAFLPGDIDQNGIVTPTDLLRFRQAITGQWQPAAGRLELYIDIDRNGLIEPLDLLRLRNLIMGTGDATQIWAGQALQSPQP